MKKILVLSFLFVLFYEATQSQNKPSKQETINWIAAKLQKSVTNLTYTTSEISVNNHAMDVIHTLSDFRIEYSNAIVTVHYYAGDQDKFQNGKIIPAMDKDVTASFDLNNISSFSFTYTINNTTIDRMVLILKTSGKQISFSQVSRHKSDSKYSNGTYQLTEILIPIDFGSEPNLQQRLTKALNDLINGGSDNGYKSNETY